MLHFFCYYGIGDAKIAELLAKVKELNRPLPDGKS